MSTFEPKITRTESTSSVQSKLKTARELAQQGRLEDALGEVEAALRLDPGSKAAQMAAGSLKARLERHDDALKNFKEALRLDPLNLQAHMRMARVYLAKKELEKASELALNAEKIDARSPLVQLLLGHIHLERKNFEKAREHLTKALLLNPRLVRARVQMATLLRQEGKTDEALAQLNAAIRIEPENEGVFEILGRLHLSRKDFEAAREAFEKSLSLNPTNDSRARFGLTEALLEAGEIERAEEMLRKVSSRYEGRPRFHKMWGDLYHKRGMFPEAVEEYRAAQTLAAAENANLLPSTEPMPVSGDLEKWRELSTSLKAATDEIREERRTELEAGTTVED